jgi:hypothetical protein
MAELPAHLNFWRYPVKAATAPDLDYRGKKKPVYPIKKFTKKECCAYVIEEWRGQYDGLIENKKTGEVKNRGYPGLKHSDSRKMEPYRRRLDPALRYLSPGQKVMAGEVWKPWTWSTAGYVTKHFTVVDLWGIKRLIGYGERERCKSKTYIYDRPLIATKKPKYKEPTMPRTLWGEPERLRIRGTWSFLG